MASSSSWSLSLSLPWWPVQRSHEIVILVHWNIPEPPEPELGLVGCTYLAMVSAWHSSVPEQFTELAKNARKRACGPAMGCFMPSGTIAWLRFSRCRMFWGSLNVWVPNGFGFWKITNSLPLKIVLLQMFHAGLPYGCVSNAEHVP